MTKLADAALRNELVIDEETLRNREILPGNEIVPVRKSSRFCHRNLIRIDLFRIFRADFIVAARARLSADLCFFSPRRNAREPHERWAFFYAGGVRREIKSSREASLTREGGGGEDRGRGVGDKEFIVSG